MQTTTAHPDREIERMARPDPLDADLYANLKSDEDLRLKPYRDSRGNLTIGIGSNIEGAEFTDAKREIIGNDPSKGITQEQARALYDLDIGRVRSEMDADFGEAWKQWPREAQLAVMNLSFNLGGPRFDGFTDMKAALQKGDFDAAADALLDSKYARTDTRNRARRLAKLLRAAAKR